MKRIRELLNELTNLFVEPAWLHGVCGWKLERAVGASLNSPTTVHLYLGTADRNWFCVEFYINYPLNNLLYWIVVADVKFSEVEYRTTVQSNDKHIGSE